MSKLSLFFELINDTSWHRINDLSKTLKVPPKRLSAMSKLLSEHNIVEYKHDTEEVKINPDWKFLCEKKRPSPKKQKPQKHNAKRLEDNDA